MINQKNKLVNALNNNINFGVKKFYIRKTTEILKYLNILYKEGVILSFIAKDNEIVVTTANPALYVNDKVRLLSKKKIKNNKKYEDLVTYSTNLQTLYLSTSKGIISIKDAKLNKLGGYPLILI